MNSRQSSSDEEALRFPYWRRNLQVIPAANLLCSLGFTLCWPFLPLIVRGLGVQQGLETWVGYTMLAFYVVSFLGAPLWGAIADHFGRKIMVLRAMLGMGACMLLLPLAQTPLWFMLILMLVGVFNGAVPAGMALLVANTPPSRMGSALSWAHSGAMAGQTMGPAVGTVLAAVIGRPHWMFWISGSLLIAGGLLVLFFVREVKQSAPGPWRLEWLGSLRELLAVPRMGALYLLHLVNSVLWTGNVTVISIYALHLLEATPAAGHNEALWVGAAAAALAISGIVALPLWGRVVDRKGAEPVLTFATFAAVLTTLPLLFVQTPLQLVIARVAFGLSAAAMAPAIVQLLKKHSPAGMDARAISYASAVNYVGLGLGPFCAGLIGPALGLRTYFALTVVLTIAGFVLWMRDRRAVAGSSSSG